MGRAPKAVLVTISPVLPSSTFSMISPSPISSAHLKFDILDERYMKNSEIHIPFLN
jgi:hypothetical protein